MPTILCVEPDARNASELESQLRGQGHEVALASATAVALERISRRGFDLILASAAPGAGPDLIEALRNRGDTTPVVALASETDPAAGLDCVRRGALECLVRPFPPECLRIAVTQGAEIGRLARDNAECRRRILAIQGLPRIIGRSSALSRVLERIDSVAPSRSTVLLEGEPGTGKKLLARAIHEQSPRRDRPFVVLRCASIPAALLEAELFGQEGPVGTHVAGAFEQAHEGTLVLDEVGAIPPDLQPLLLRAVQEHEFERRGGARPVRAEVRLIATTCRDLRDEVAAGRFRRELYFRISAVPIRVPPLRERIEDLAELAAHFAAHIAAETGIPAPAIPAATVDALASRVWAGNVRELAHEVARAVVLHPGSELPSNAFGSSGATGACSPEAALPTLNLSELRTLAFARALRATGGRRRRTAALLGVSERTLRNMLARERRRSGDSLPVGVAAPSRAAGPSKPAARLAVSGTG